jgi:18S rRNA (guanine1575-N7)-methyltransferase
MSRPEHLAPPEIFYNEDEAGKYTGNSRIIEIQTAMTKRCVELLNIPEDSPPLFLLDIGCGSGLSGNVLTELGHVWVGLDIAPSMLEIASQRDGSKNEDLMLWDMGHGLSFRPGTFDGAISVSALQWLCNADTKANNPIQRINRFFQTLYASLSRGARAVLQVYPENAQQMELLTSSAMRQGFQGGLVVDFPHSTRAKKYFLVLFAGMLPTQEMPRPIGVDEEDPIGVKFERDRRRERKRGEHRPSVKSRDWILLKKERQRRQGKSVKPDTKYTGRQRKPKF